MGSLEQETSVAFDLKRGTDSGNEIDIETRLWRVVEYLGYSCTPEEILSFAREDFNFRFGTMDKAQVLKFVQAYHSHQINHLRELFRAVEAKGPVTVDDVVKILANYPPRADVESSVVEDLILGQNEGRSLKLEVTFDEFETLFENLRFQRGFSKDQMIEFGEAFVKFADKKGDSKNLIRVSDMREILMWVGCSYIEGLDYDGKTHLTQMEFLNLVESYRRSFKLRASSVFAQWAHEDGMELRYVPFALEVMDYSLRADIIIDTLSDVGISATIYDLLYEGDARATRAQWLALLNMLNRKDGLTWRELEEIKEAYESHVQLYGKLEGRVRTVNKLFRTLGFLHMVKATRVVIAAEVKRTKRRPFELYQFIMFVRVQFTFMHRRLMNCFSWHASVDVPRKIPEEWLITVLRLSNFPCTNTNVIQNETRKLMHDTNDGLSYLVVLQIAHNVHKKLKKRFIADRAFLDDDLDRFRNAFKRFDRKEVGWIDAIDAKGVLTTIHPHEDEVAQTMMKIVDQSELKRFEFSDTLDLLRSIEDWKTARSYKDEESAIEETGFNIDEVEEFRSCFIAVDIRTNKKLDYDEFLSYIRCVYNIAKDDRITLEIKNCMNAYLTTLGAPGLGFPDFLRFMHLLMQKNLINFHLRRKIFTV